MLSISTSAACEGPAIVTHGVVVGPLDRFEVAVEQYSTKLNIEAEVAASIARTMILPAAVRYLGEHGPEYLEPTADRPRYLIKFTPTKVTSWEGVEWAEKYTKPQAAG